MDLGGVVGWGHGVTYTLYSTHFTRIGQLKYDEVITLIGIGPKIAEHFSKQRNVDDVSRK